MNNRLLLFFVLAALLFAAALPGGTVFAAGKTATLLEFKHVPAKGWTAIFAITGDWKKADLKGNTITIGKNTYDMYCNFKDEKHISCTMHHDVGKQIGRSARFNIAGLDVYNTYITGVVPQKARKCHAWQAGFSHYYEEGEWLESYLASTKTYAELWQYYGWEQWGIVTYGPDAPLDPEFFSLYLEYNYASWNTFFGTSYIETGAYEIEGFGYYDHKCASWADEPLDEASYQYQGWAEWSGSGGELCVGTNCWLIDEEWEEHEYESCEAEDGSCFDE
jgi:hypothetical protein